MQVSAPQRPLRILSPLRAEAEPARVLIPLEQMSIERPGKVLWESEVQLVELAPPCELVIAQQRPPVGDFVRHPQHELRRILDGRRDRLGPEDTGGGVEQTQ